MSDWPKYKSHKIVRVARIVSIHDDLGEGPFFLWVDPGTGTLEKFETTELGMMRRASVGDFAILYPDGFKSICPRAQFDEGYTQCEPDAAELGAAVRAAGLAGS